MTNITIRKNSDGDYVGFELNGHAGSGDYGKDIVCASISVLSINTVNSLEELTGDDIVCNADPNEGIIRLDFNGPISNDAELLMKSFELGITSIYKQYGNEFLNIKFEEV